MQQTKSQQTKAEHRQLPIEPFYPETLNEQLDRETRKFLNNPDKVRLDRDNNILYHSAILEWFEEDFLVNEPDIKTFIGKYININDKTYLQNHNVELQSLEYDWGLNKQ